MNTLGVPAAPSTGLGKGGRLKWLAVPSVISIAGVFFLGWRLGKSTNTGGPSTPDDPPLVRLVAEHTRADGGIEGQSSTRELHRDQASEGTLGAAIQATAAATQRSLTETLRPDEDSPPKPQPAAGPDSPDAASADDSGDYHIQVASLTSGVEADSLASALGRLGFRAKASPYGHSGGKWWHVVRIGPFDETKEIRDPETTDVSFEADLPPGPAELWTWLTMPDGNSHGAYFVTVERLN